MRNFRIELLAAGLFATALLAVGLTAGASPPKQFATLVHVDVNASGFVHDGETWETAFLTIQDGVDAAAELVAEKQGLDVPMVWVAEGTYRETVTLADGIVVWGGFGGTETLYVEWNPQDHETIIDGEGVRRCLVGANCNVGWMTIRGGFADYGGGISSVEAVPFVTSCTFINNRATSGGGAAFNEYSPAWFISCRFLQNHAVNGGAIHNVAGGRPFVVNCVFDGNTAMGLGGAIFSEGTAAPVVTNCTFARNTAEVGGGMYNGHDTAAVVTNCVFRNDAPEAILEEEAGDTTVSYCNIEGGFAGTENMFGLAAISLLVKLQYPLGHLTGSGSISTL